MILWVLARDPTRGVPLTEGGQARSFTYEGSWAHEMPTIVVIYDVDDHYVTIHEVRFSNPPKDSRTRLNTEARAEINS